MTTTTITRSKTATIGVAAVIAVAIFMTTAITGANAQPTPAPAPAVDCVTQLYTMADCLTFVTTGSNLTRPDPGCCSELAALVANYPICLCQLLGNPGATGVDIDLNKATKLPNVCNVSTPPVTLCSAFGVPVAVPAASEGPGVSFGPNLTPVSAPGSTPGSDNGISSIAAIDITIFMGYAIAFVTLFL